MDAGCGAWARAIARASSWREMMSLAAASGRDAAPGQRTAQDAAVPTPATPATSRSVCAQPRVPDLQRHAPGDLIAAEEITPQGDAAFPANARAWRVLYASTGRDNTERTLACGIVVAPAEPADLAVVDVDGTATGRVVAWCHGTLGVVQRCQPSQNPASEIWGPPPFGINQVAWGSAARGDAHAGTPAEGILAGMIDAGWIVAATDYASDLSTPGALAPFVIGKIEAANVIDCVRAAHHLLRGAHESATERYDVVTWGHSQGGHAALWAGQLLAPYGEATRVAGGPRLALSGVALEAPVSHFIATAADDAPGSGLLDWTVHAALQLTGQPVAIPLAPFFFSYVFGVWAQHSRAGAGDEAEMPAFPATGPLDLSAALTPAAIATLDEMAKLCWADGEQVATLAAPFATTPFFVPQLADGPVIAGRQRGGFDQTCAGDPPPELARWCEWIAYNDPGPQGRHPFARLPLRDGRPAPMLITAGANDGVVHCVAPDPASDVVPDAGDCAPVALYEALRPFYCPATGAESHLQLLIWREEAGVTIADHSDVTGLISAAGRDDLRFRGSPLEQFISGAFAGTLRPGCTAAVANPGTPS